MKSTKGGKIMDFLIKFIISRYYVPSNLLMDNGTSFRSNEFRYFYVEYHIERKSSPPYYPQGNGQVKALNKINKTILSKIVAQHGKYLYE